MSLHPWCDAWTPLELSAAQPGVVPCQLEILDMVVVVELVCFVGHLHISSTQGAQSVQRVMLLSILVHDRATRSPFLSVQRHMCSVSIRMCSVSLSYLSIDTSVLLALSFFLFLPVHSTVGRWCNSQPQ